MIILNTKFRLSSECGKDVFLRRFQQHLQNDIRWSSLSHLEDLLTGDYSGEVDGNTIHAFTSDDAVVISLHRSYDETDQDFVYLIDEESPHLSVKISRNTSEEESFVRAEIPGVIRGLLWNGYIGKDGILPVSDTALRIDNLNLATAERVFSGPEFENPIIYISSTQTGAPVFGYECLAHQMAGIAHVIYEANPYIGAKLQTKIGERKPYNGAIRILYPNGKEFLHRADNRTGESLKRAVIKDVIRYVNTQPMDDRFNVLKIKAAMLEKRLKGNEELSGIFEEILSDKDQQIKQMKGEIGRLIQQIDDMETNKNRMQSKIDNLSYNFETVMENTEGTVIQSSEKEFYPHEIRDVILRLVNTTVNQMEGDPNQEETRKYHILMDIMKNNVFSGRREELVKVIEDAFGKEPGISTIDFQALRDIGFHEDVSGPHIRMDYNGDKRYNFTVSKTPGDNRQGMNTIKEITNRLF